MALKTIVTDLGEVDEAYHGLYEQKGDQFVLQIEGIDNHPAVVALRNGHMNSKKERDEARRENAELKKKLEAVPDDFDSDEWARLKADAEARENDPDGKDVRAQIETATKAVKDQMQAKLDRQQRDFEAKLAEKDAELAKRDGEIRRRVATDGLRSALASAQVNPGLIDGAVAMFDRDVEVVLEDDQYVARMRSDLGGDPVETYISNWAQSDAAKAWIDPPKGGDEKGNQLRPGGGTDNPFGKSAWNKTAQARLINSNRAKAEQLAKAAGFKSLEATYSATGPVAA